MGIKTVAGFTAMLFLIFLVPASAAMTVSEAKVNTTLVVSALPPGTNVQFVLNGGTPVFAIADAAGTARYLPLFEGSLEIIVKQNGVITDRATVTILPATTTTPAVTAGSTPATGTGGGGGGGGMATPEPNENIEKTDRNEKSLISNIPITYTFTVPGIYQIIVTGTDNENLISIRVEALKGTSKLVSTAPPGIVYKNLNVWAGTKRIKKAVIRFKVEKSWMQGKNLAAGDMKMLRWNAGKWEKLETKETGNDSTYANFETSTETLSNFAITGLKGEVLPAAPAAGVTQTSDKPGTIVQAAVPKQKVVGFEFVTAIAALCWFYVLRRRK